jgi:hypothetical protein
MMVGLQKEPIKTMRVVMKREMEGDARRNRGEQ